LTQERLIYKPGTYYVESGTSSKVSLETIITFFAFHDSGTTSLISSFR